MQVALSLTRRLQRSAFTCNQNLASNSGSRSCVSRGNSLFREYSAADDIQFELARSDRGRYYGDGVRDVNRATCAVCATKGDCVVSGCEILEVEERSLDDG